MSRRMRRNSATKPEMSLPIEETIAEITDCERPLLSSKLVALSNLNAEELELFAQEWAEVELKRRRQIIYRLVELAEDNVELNFDSIFRDCLEDRDDEVRGKAIEGLWENEETSLISPLIDMLANDSSDKVRAAAATALGKFAMLAEDRKLRSSHVSEVCKALLAVIDDENSPVEVRRRALEAAGPLNLPRVDKAIMHAYESGNTRLKISAIYAMGGSCNPSWLPVLLKELTSADIEIRYEAVRACGELGEEEAVPYIIKLTGDPDVDVCMAAIQALGKIGGTVAKEHLTKCQGSSDEAVRQAAEQAIEELETEEDPFSFVD